MRVTAIKGDVTLAPLFDDLNRIARLDVLGDIIGLLQRKYDLALEEKRAELKGTKE